jgi:hypothetical protein
VHRRRDSDVAGLRGDESPHNPHTLSTCIARRGPHVEPEAPGKFCGSIGVRHDGRLGLSVATKSSPGHTFGGFRAKDHDGFRGASAIAGLMLSAVEFRDLDANSRSAGVVHIMSGHDEMSALENRQIAASRCASASASASSVQHHTELREGRRNGKGRSARPDGEVRRRRR